MKFMKQINLSIAVLAICLICSCQKKSEFDTDLIPVETKENGWVFIDSEGETQIKTVQPISEPTYFIEGFSRVKLADGTLTFINKKGEFINQKKYVNATVFNEGIAWVVEENDYPRAINRKGEVLFGLKNCETAKIFTEGLAPVCFMEDGIKVWGYVNDEGKTSIAPTFVACSNFRNGLAPAVKNEGLGWGYIDKKGKLVIQQQFSRAECFGENGLAIVGIGDIYERKYGIINKKGKYVVSPQYDYIESDGDFYKVRSSSVYGWIDKEGGIVINPQFKFATSFGKSDITGVSIDGEKYGLIDREGKYIMNPQYDLISSFIGDIAPFYMGGKYGFIDKKGEIVINPQYSDTKYYHMDDSEDLCVIETDYFDVKSVVSNFMKDLSTKSFRGISGNTTFGQLQKMYKNLSYDSSSSRKSNEVIDLSNGVGISETLFYFPEKLVTSSYNYYNSTYETEENTGLYINSVIYHLDIDYSLKAADKRPNIVQGIVKAIMQSYNISEDNKTESGQDLITLQADSIDFNIKCSSDIWIEVIFKN